MEGVIHNGNCIAAEVTASYSPGGTQNAVGVGWDARGCLTQVIVGDTGDQVWYYSGVKTYVWQGTWKSYYPDGNICQNQDDAISRRTNQEGWDQVLAFFAGYGWTVGQSPNVYWPDGPIDVENCTDEEPVDCSEKTDEIESFYTADGIIAGSTELCIEGCEAINNVMVTVRKPDCDSNGTADDPCTLFPEIKYTGEECGETDPEATKDDRTCPELQAECDTLCEGGTNNTCTDPATFVCDCELPDYPVIQDNGTYKPDQDEDSTPSDTDTDVDGDGTPNTTDDDVDGDGNPNGNDTDTDGDGTSNRGTKTWTNDDFSSGGYFDNHNGYGTDADLDGDGTPNATDPDIDGDGIPNGEDPDMDADGVSNGGDVDADGDGILDGADGDADGDGLPNDEDIDPDGSGVGDADTNNDGVVDANDEPAPTEEWPTEEEIESGYDGVGENSYDSTIEGDFTDPDYQGAAQDIMDANPLSDDLDGSEIQLTNIDSCIDFPNPYTGGTEQFCFNKYDSYWRAMGFLFIGVVGFMCFRLIAWRY